MTLADFQAFGIHEGPGIAEKLGDIGEIAGHYAAVAASGLKVETVPIFSAWSGAGGRITREAFDFFAAKLGAGLRAAGQLDGLTLYLHGACAADGIDDVEGEQAALCRAILGPIMLGLDHHASVTRKMVEASTAIVGHRTQPHDLGAGQVRHHGRLSRAHRRHGSGISRD